MTRPLAYIVAIDDLQPIAKADRIELARIGGWQSVVNKNQFAVGDHAVYIEIDTFLPPGVPAWQFLVDKQTNATLEDGTKGHVLRTVTLKNTLSQGFLVSMDHMPAHFATLPLYTDVTAELGLSKYTPPIPKELIGVARGRTPSCLPDADLVRVQNLREKFQVYQEDEDTWEVTEKLEGSTCIYAWLEDGLHACTTSVDFLENPTQPVWAMAHAMQLKEKLETVFGQAGARRVALYGEWVGPGVEGNIYRLDTPQYFVFQVYEVDKGRWWDMDERQNVASTLGIGHAPVIHEAWTLSSEVSAEQLLAMANGPSALRPGQAREGLVFKNRRDPRKVFKVISNDYLLGGTAKKGHAIIKDEPKGKSMPKTSQPEPDFHVMHQEVHNGHFLQILHYNHGGGFPYEWRFAELPPGVDKLGQNPQWHNDPTSSTNIHGAKEQARYAIDTLVNANQKKVAPDGFSNPDEMTPA